MGVGQSQQINKGFVAGGTTAYVQGLICEVTAEATVNLALTADVLTPLVVCAEDMTAVRLIATPGKIIINCAVTGIVRVAAGGVVTMGDRVTNDNTARAVTRARAGAGVQPKATFGIALTSASAAGQHIDVLLTPGATY